MKKTIVIEYEKGKTNCNECPFLVSITACAYLEELGLECEKVKFKSVNTKDNET